ncbi:MAG TPA: antitoxin Xre/MbcA/ParS toxin-binding domain-containing protein [Croceibacterium sp.]
MSAPDGAAPARRGSNHFRKAQGPRLEPEQARRQGDITRLAFLLLGRDAAIAFLNTDNAELHGRPLDLATASDDGRNQVEAAIGRLAYVQPGAAQ